MAVRHLKRYASWVQTVEEVIVKTNLFLQLSSLSLNPRVKTKLNKKTLITAAKYSDIF